MAMTTQLFSASILLGQDAHQLADQFCQFHADEQKSQQVYLNTLAVYALNYYLNCLGFETSWQFSHSHDPVMQTLLDVADLIVQGHGKLECRHVLPGEETVCIPEEVRADRIGYVIILLNHELSEAELLGFVDSAEVTTIRLEQLQPLEQLLDRLNQSQSAVLIQKPPIHLSHWLQGIWLQGWQALDKMFEVPQFAFRRPESNQSSQAFPVEPDQQPEISGGKLLTLGAEVEVALLVSASPNGEELDILVELCSVGNQSYLPAELEVFVLDEVGTAVMQSQSRQAETLQFRFSTIAGERFSIKIAFGAWSIIEDFMI